MKCYEQFVSVKGTLSRRGKREHEILLTACVASLLMCVLAVTVEGDWAVFFVSVGFAAVASAIPVLIMLCGRPVSKHMMRAHVALTAMSILLSDISAWSGRGGTFWPLFVVLVDLSLVLRLGRRFSLAFVFCILVWLILVNVERSVRFGLFDLPGLPPQDYRRERLEEMCSCVDRGEAAPCPISAEGNSVYAFISIGVFIVDFLATRGFAQQLDAEQKSMEKTIAAVQDIAENLAEYDVDTVAAILDGSDLPDEMHAALQKIEYNLRAFRPYLPSALFDQLMRSASDTDSALVRRAQPIPPGVESGGQGEATVVFTDIRASTSIWEAAPEGMRKAIQIHNKLIRSVIELTGGYEVKTIGDAFMVAFQETASGMNFALTVHQTLLEAPWPADLLEVPICAERDSLWAGLTVRIGVNTGSVTIEENPLTGRVDYYGHTVNVAARLESQCVPGAVAVRAPLWEEVRDICHPAVSGKPAALSLKGVTKPVMVCCVWPAALEERRRCPLSEAVANPLEAGEESLLVRTISMSQPLLLTALPMRMATATVGLIQLATDGQGGGHPGDVLSRSLESLAPLLQGSGGTIMSLTGSRVSLGWNVTRPAQAHAESALWFMHRFKRTVGSFCEGAGAATGSVQHGDVGSSTQRFFTVLGAAVGISWKLCDEAVLGGTMCLYAPPPGMDLPSALHEDLHAVEASSLPGVAGVVYELVPTSITPSHAWSG